MMNELDTQTMTVPAGVEGKLCVKKPSRNSCCRLGISNPTGTEDDMGSWHEVSRMKLGPLLRKEPIKLCPPPCYRLGISLTGPLGKIIPLRNQNTKSMPHGLGSRTYTIHTVWESLSI